MYTWLAIFGTKISIPEMKFIFKLSVMLYIQPSDFLRSKIIELKTAILHCPDDHFFNLQSVIAQTLGVDEEGIVWLAVDKPVSCAGESTGSFDVVLNYHKKDTPYDLDVLGDASTVSHDDWTCPGFAKNALNKGKIVLRVQVMDIDYWQQKTSLFKNISHRFHQLFAGSHEEDAKQHIYSDHRMSA